MLEKLELLKKGLDRANKEGMFTMEESSLLLTSYVQVKQYLESKDKEDQAKGQIKEAKEEVKSKK